MNQEKGKEKLEKTDYEIVSALLDFNSDRAEAHAAFLVACVFGLFALLSVLEDSPKGSPNIVAYSVAYLILWSGGIWEVFNFYRYATRADHFRRLVRDTKPSLFEKPIENVEKRRAEKSFLFRLYYSLREYKHLRHNKLFLITTLYAIVGFLPWLSVTGILPWFIQQPGRIVALVILIAVVFMFIVALRKK